MVRFLVFTALTGFFVSGESQATDALERMQLPRLAAVHNTVEQFRLDRRDVPLQSGFDDVRALLHVHSQLSHDSVGTPEEIRQAAIEAGVRVILFTNHPADSYDYIRDGHRGIKDGVMFIPGAEEKGLLCFPQRSVQRRPEFTPQDKVNTVNEADGQAYLCHLEERMDWDLNGLTGSEIYNIHADFKDEPALFKAISNPLTLISTIAPAVRQYPQEVIAALQDYPADYLRRWDELCQTQRLTGISANDAHQNNGLRAIVQEDGTVRLMTPLDEEVGVLDPGKVPLLRVLLGDAKPGQTIFELQLDPYVCSFRHVSTHLLMNDFTEEAVRNTLAAGRAYVAFDWICDPTGFVFHARQGDNTIQMGEETDFQSGLTLHAGAPLTGTFKVMRNGREVHHGRSQQLDYSVSEPGVYRVEVWLNFPDEPRVWILTNPIYVR